MAIQLFALVVGLVVWELYATTQPAYFFPSWAAIHSAFLELVYDYNLLPLFARSIMTVLIGFAVAAAVGIPLAFLMGLNDRVANVLNPYVNALYVAPTSALIPIIIYIGGASFESRIFVVFLFAVFEITIDTYEGIATTPQGVIDAARSFGASRLFIIKNIIYPHNLPFMFTGLRLGAGRAVRGMILAELLVEFSNVGGLIRTMQNSFRLDGVLALVLLVMALGIVLTQIVKMIQNHVITWSAEVEL